VDQLASQWPLLAGFLFIAAALLKVLQGVYERWLADVIKQRDDAIRQRDAWMEAAFTGTDMAGVMTGVVEQTARKRQP